MTSLQETVRAHAEAAEKLQAVDFHPGLRQWLAEEASAGRFLAGWENREVDTYAHWVLKFNSFWVSPQQTSKEGLTLSYGSRDHDDCYGELVLPWRLCENSDAVPTVATEATQQHSEASHIRAKLEEYVLSRGIPMPVYYNGSKITEEAGELREALQAHLSAPSEATLAHLKEEVADVTIVAAVAAYQFFFTVEEALEAKIAKDKARGPKP